MIHLATELPKPPDAWSESFRALAIELGLPVQDLEQAHAYLRAFWGVTAWVRSRNPVGKGKDETCLAGSPASQASGP
jgi:hypothetical protein